MMKSQGKSSNSERLWAPWRITYIQSDKNKRGCIFCGAFKRKNEQVIFTTRHSVAMLNIYPYNNGHLMVAPRRHVKDISPLTDTELLDLFRCVDTVKKLLTKAMKPDGFNIGINVGRAGGAGITGHVHVHIVPRWVGDTNFMPALAATKVISQSLEELRELLQSCVP